MNEISVDQALAKAKSFLNKGKTNEASDFYSFVLDRFPKNKRAHDGLVITHDILAGDHLGSIISEYNQGELATVIEKVQSLTKKLTHASLLWNILGVAFNDQKRFEEAILSLKTAISLKYDFAEAYFNIGSVFYERADYRAAINNFQQALKFKPQYFDALNNLGSAFRGVGELEAALGSFEQAVKINPKNASTHFNVGVILHDQGNNEEAINAYSKAISLKSNCAPFYNNLGVALKDTGNKKKALEAYEKALSIDPDYIEALNNAGAVLNSQGQKREAIEAFKKALNIKPNYHDAYVNMSNALTRTAFSEHDEHLQKVIVSLLEHKTFVCPRNISDAAISLLKCDPNLKHFFKKRSADESIKSLQVALDKLSGSSLLIKLMSVCPIIDIELEILFTDIRSMLLSCISNFNATPNILRFLSALALQCHTNGYIYAQTNSENKMLEELDASVSKMLMKGEQPSPQIILCLASYKSLGGYNWDDSIYLIDGVIEVFERQVSAPKKEDLLKSDILVLEKIKNEVSLEVGEQYESRPYPQWVDLGLPLKPYDISNMAKNSQLKLSDQSITEVKSPHILIAGCGTGKQSITTAATYANSKVLAIDLSLASLAYAKRKAHELGIKNIEHMQADILNLEKLEQKFDIIECVGVLHHMEDPMAGWKKLRNLLKSGGLLKIGLYSEFARKHIVELREEIRMSEVGVTDDAIKSFRHTLIQANSEPYQKISLFDDFYSLNEFNDLLFNVKEHRFTLTQIQKCLVELDLTFCGFETNAVLQEYKLKNPKAEYCYDLDEWQVFEEQNQSLFAGMYQFWCQKTN